MTQTQAQPLAKAAPREIKSLLESDSFRQQVSKVLPSICPPETFTRVALTALTRTPLLAQCDQQSFFAQLLRLAEYGLPPDGRRAHLIPFWNSKRNCHEVQLIIDYRGLVELVMRPKTIASIHADIVCENDEFEYDLGQITKHKINFRKDRGAPYAAYAIIRFRDPEAEPKCEVMSLSEIEAIRARSRAANNGPWVTDWAAMAKKTVFKRASKWLPQPTEHDQLKVQTALDADDDVAVAPEILRPKFAAPKENFLEAPSTEETPAINVQSPEPQTAPTPAPVDPPVKRGPGRPRNPVPKSEPPAEEERPEVKAADLNQIKYLKAIRDLLTAGNKTEDKLIAFLIESGNLKTGQALEDLATSTLKSVHDGWNTISGLLE